MQDFLTTEEKEFESKVATYQSNTSVKREDLKDWLRSHDARLIAKVVEMVESKRKVSDCHPHKEDPVGRHEYKENADWRSECVHCGVERKDAEDITYNQALDDLLSLLQG